MANRLMVVLARESRGLSQVELAERSGLYQTTISRYESGQIEISESHAERFAKVLDYPEAFFYVDEPVHGLGSGCESYFRRRKDLPSKQFKEIHARVNILRIQCSHLLRYLQLEIPSQIVRLEAGANQSPAKAARHVRSMLGLPKGPVENLVQTFELAGGLAFFWPFGTEKFDAVSQWPAGDLPYVFSNASAPGDRLRYTIAHELGHIVMHDRPVDDMERQADGFAAEFLMPASDISRDLESMSLAKAFELKKRWKVSMASLVKRAKDLGYLSEWRYKTLFMEIGRLGYRTSEPNPIPRERPTFVSHIINISINKYGYNINRLRKMSLSNDSDFRRYFWPVTDTG